MVYAAGYTQSGEIMKAKKNLENRFPMQFKRWIAGEFQQAAALTEKSDRAECAHKEVSVKTGKISKIDVEKQLNAQNLLYRCISFIMTFAIIGSMLWNVHYLPTFAEAEQPMNNEVSERYIEKSIEETGAVNAVTAMILDYRAFDTFGESCVLYIAAVVVMAALKQKKIKIRKYKHRDKILSQISLYFVPMIFLFGIYIVLNGHLSPGGGFAGGAIISAGMILYANAFGTRAAAKIFNDKTYIVCTVSALGFYCCAKAYSFFTGANHLESGIPTGTPGSILSGGLILPLNICVGITVAATMYSFYSLFRNGGYD